MKCPRPILGLVVVAILLAGTYPRTPADESRLSWLEPGPGLLFEARSQCISETPLWIDAGAMTFELWLRSGAPGRTGNSEIFSVLDGPGVHRLMVGQFSDGLIFRGRFDNPTGDPKRDLYAEPWPHADLRHLAVTVGSKGALLFANGQATGLTLPATRAEAGVPFGGRLLLGTSDSSWSEWRGSLLALAVHQRMLGPTELAQHANLEFGPQRVQSQAGAPTRLDGMAQLSESRDLVALYLFEEGRGARAESSIPRAPALLFPRSLTRPLRTTLFTGLSHQRWLPSDVALNVLGFAPLGLVIAWGRRRHGLWMAFACGATLSLGIELAQLLIPGRDSSLVDLIGNVAGTLLGGLLALGAWHFVRSSGPTHRPVDSR